MLWKNTIHIIQANSSTNVYIVNAVSSSKNEFKNVSRGIFIRTLVGF